MPIISYTTLALYEYGSLVSPLTLLDGAYSHKLATLQIIYSLCGGCAKESPVCHLSSPLSSEVLDSEAFVHLVIQRISNLIPAV